MAKTGFLIDGFLEAMAASRQASSSQCSLFCHQKFFVCSVCICMLVVAGLEGEVVEPSLVGSSPSVHTRLTQIYIFVAR